MKREEFLGAWVLLDCDVGRRHVDSLLSAARAEAFEECAKIAASVQPREHAMGYEARVKADIVDAIRAAARSPGEAGKEKA